MRKVVHIVPSDNYQLFVTFACDGQDETRLYDMSDELTGVFEYLRDYKHFNAVCLVDGVPTWFRPNANELDICPDYVYMHSQVYSPCPTAPLSYTPTV